MFVNAIIKTRMMGEPWRMHVAWMDPATCAPHPVCWIHAPSVCRSSWMTDETLTVGGEIVFFEIVESWADDFEPQSWETDKHHDVGLCPRFGGLELSLQDKDGYSWLTLNPEQAREMAAYLTRWAEGVCHD